MLKQLFDVQTKDLEIDTIRAEIDLTPKELLETQALFEQLEAKLESARAQFSELRKEANVNELEIANLEARRKSANDNAVNASSSKEVSQFQNQALQFSTRIQELEEDTFPILEKMETLQERISSLEAEYSELKPKIDEMKDLEEKRIQDINEKIQVLAKSREALSSKIEAHLLKQYEQVRRARRGVGMAPIKNKSCSGCNVQLPIFVIQKAMKGNAIVRCPSCGRILWAQSNKE